MAAYRNDGLDVVETDGEPLRLTPQQSLGLGLVLHELGTNSAKYGALSGTEGRVSVNWRIFTDEDGQRQMEIAWDETSAPRADDEEAERRRGFGSVVLQRVAPQALLGTAKLDRSSGMVRWSLTAPFDAVIAPNASETPAPVFP